MSGAQDRVTMSIDVLEDALPHPDAVLVIVEWLSGIMDRIGEDLRNDWEHSGEHREHMERGGLSKARAQEICGIIRESDLPVEVRYARDRLGTSMLVRGRPDAKG